MPVKTKPRDRTEEFGRLSITVNREEWDALHAMRERTEVALATHEALQRRYDELLAVNSGQLRRLTELTLRDDHLKVCIKRAEERERLLIARVKSLENVLLTAQGVKS